MRNTLKIFLSLLAVPFALVACGDDTNTNTSTGPTLAELNDKVLDAFCSGAVECHRTETVADCKASQDVSLDEITAAVEAGTVKYHPEKVDACLEGLSGLSVCAYSDLPTTNDTAAQAACTAVFEGTVADGGTCSIDEMCVSGNCEPTDPMCSMQCCPSKCAPAQAADMVAKLGESCVDPSIDCEDGTYCKLDAMFMPTVCAAQVALGEACTSYGSCKAPSICDLDFQTMMGTCKAPIAHGGACDPMGALPCDRFDDICDGVSKTCVTQGLPGADCMMQGCVAYAECNMMNKCEKSPVAGEACVSMNGSSNCLGSLACVNGKCTKQADMVCP